MYPTGTVPRRQLPFLHFLPSPHIPPFPLLMFSQRRNSNPSCIHRLNSPLIIFNKQSIERPHFHKNINIDRKRQPYPKVVLHSCIFVFYINCCVCAHILKSIETDRDGSSKCLPHFQARSVLKLGLPRDPSFSLLRSKLCIQ